MKDMGTKPVRRSRFRVAAITLDDDNLLLTIQEVADYLKCGITKVRELLKSGAIASFKIGHHRRVKLGSVKEYVHQQSEQKK